MQVTSIFHFFVYEPMAGVEPATSSLPRKRSTTELHRQNEPVMGLSGIYYLFVCPCALTFILRAEDGTQTRDPQLGRLMLYRLSYFRKKIPHLVLKTEKKIS